MGNRYVGGYLERTSLSPEIKTRVELESKQVERISGE